CNWEEIGWLTNTQCIPIDGKNIISHYNTPAKRAEIYTEIKKELKSLITKFKITNKISKLNFTNKKIILNSFEKITLETVEAYMDTGDYISAKNLYLGAMQFEEATFDQQL